MHAELLRKINALRVGEKEDIDRYQESGLVDRVRAAESYFAQLVDSLFGETKIIGLALPWAGTSDKFRLRPGELTIWSGANGDGKSLVLSQVMLKAIQQEASVVIASLELHPVETLKRMAVQFLRLSEEKIGERGLEDFIDQVAGSLWLYDEVGDISPARVSALARYVRAELKADYLVIDSLMKCGTLEQDYAAEKMLVNSLQNIAKQSGLAIHLVAHSRKPREGGISSRYDVKGSGTITDMADNVITVMRNRDKELESRKPKPDEEKLAKPDCYLICDKQRHYQWEGAIGLWFESGWFVSNVVQ